MPKSPEIKALLELALAEDDVYDDITSRLIPDVKAVGKVIAREPGIFSGLEVVQAAQDVFGKNLEFAAIVKEGTRFEKDQTLVTVSGASRRLLSLERTLLNFLGHACGVATLTSQFVESVKPHPVKILATRKTLPGLRALELKAVVAGGGYAHRRSLSDGILIKENHLLFSSDAEILAKARASRSPLHKIEIEVQSLSQLEEVLKTPPEIIMLDNFSLEDIPKAVARINGKAQIEVSGGMNLEMVKRVAPLGIQFISIGQLTHSARWHNLSMDFTKDAP